jgi:hypothetical protein
MFGTARFEGRHSNRRAGIVEKYVEAARFLNKLIDDSVGICFNRQVARQQMGLSTGTLDYLRGFLGAFAASVKMDADECAGFGQKDRRRLPNPDTGARDKDDATG